MAASFFATANVDIFTNPSHSVLFSQDISGAHQFDEGFTDPNEPYNGFVEGIAANDPREFMLDFINSRGDGLYYFEVFDDNAVNYSLSTAAVSIDLTKATQQGGFAQGDSLRDIFEVTGSSFDDVIRGSNTSDYPPDTSRTINGREAFFFTIHKPGENVLNGGNGDDVLEGRGGADVLNGGADFDFASYESSPASVTVRLRGVGSDTQTALASGGDAGGDTLSSIEGLIGSRFGDRLTGNTLNNVLAGGLGNDTLAGGDGIDTADYSRDHFFDPGDTPDSVVVRLGLSGANGSSIERLNNIGVGVDTLIGIENVTGTDGGDTITGNGQANVLDGRGGNDILDGGLGNDLIIGGANSDTATYVSHNTLTTFEIGNIALGLGSTDGTATYSAFIVNQGLQVIETDALRGIENITGSNFNETIAGNAQNNVLDGAGGIDTVSFQSHDALPAFISETNTITLGRGAGDGSYVRAGFIFNLQTGQLQPASETDTLRNFENVTGSNRPETIIGNERANVIDGRGGNDVIDGGTGDDTMIGGGGTNTASFESHNRLVGDIFVGNITLGLGSADGVSTLIGSLGSVETDVLRQFDNVIGSRHNETITGNERDNVLDGGAGDDVLIGNGGRDTASFASLASGVGVTVNLGLNGADGNAVATGGAGTDTLRSIVNVTGTNSGDTIIANEQDNTINGRGGIDGLQGGAGGDTYDYRGATGSQSNDQILDVSGTDRLLVDNLSDVLGTQQIGADLLVTLRSGSARILGHFTGTPVESIVDSQGNSLILATGQTGGNGSGIISGTSGADVMDGNGGDDWLFGNEGNDRLIGGKGDDRLYGGDGRDVVIGGPGSDFLVGGPDADTFVFKPGTFGGGHGNDVVADFSSSEHDRIDVSAFHTSFAALTHGHGPITLTTDGDDSFLTFAHGTVQIVGAAHLHAADFIF